MGKHDKVGQAVATGGFDAGALKEGTFKRLLSQGEPLKALVLFPNVTKPWIGKDSLDTATEMALRKALLSLDDKKALKELGIDGFLQGTDSDYSEIRQSIEMNADFFKS